MNLAALRQAFADRVHYPVLDAVQAERVNRAIRDILRSTIIPAMPSRGLRGQWQFRLEPPVDLSSYTWAVNANDKHILYAAGAYASLNTDGTMRARWARIVVSNIYYLRRVREVRRDPDPKGGDDFGVIILDEPWDDAAVTISGVKILTLDYPIPHYVSAVCSVCWSPDGLDQRRMESRWPADMENMQLFRRDQTGQPSLVGSGERYQLPAPHETPSIAAALQAPTNSQKWGYDVSGTERGSAYNGQRYGAAGTFSYVYCLVWGRRRFMHPTKGWGFLGPFIISAPSGASARVTTTWGASYVEVKTTNISYAWGFGNQPGEPSYNRSGLEKWIFRARHATESATSGSNHADVKSAINDGVYNLWKIVDASETSTYDRGDADPVDVQFPLQSWQGHQSLRFDIPPANSDVINCQIIVRPDELLNDQDVPNLDPMIDDIIINRLTRRLKADPDGDIALKRELDAEFATLMANYKSANASDKFQAGVGNYPQPAFGDDGLSPRVLYGPVTLREP